VTPFFAFFSFFAAAPIPDPGGVVVLGFVGGVFLAFGFPGRKPGNESAGLLLGRA
jgi:hypothetical protein